MIKSHLMPFCYNKTENEMILLYKRKEFVKIYFSKSYANNKNMFKIVKLIITTLINQFKKLYPKIILLKDLFANMANLATLVNKNIFISINKLNNNTNGELVPLLFYNPDRLKTNEMYFEDKIDNKLFNLPPVELTNFKKSLLKLKQLGFEQSYYTHKTVRYQKQIDNKRISISINKLDSLSDNLSLDRSKNKLGLYPNTIQHLDSLLLYGVISYCKIKNIPLAVIHDSFSCNQYYYKEIRLAYSLSYYYILGNHGLNNIIINFLNNLIEGDTTFLFSEFLSQFSIKDKFGNRVFSKELLNDQVLLKNFRAGSLKKYNMTSQKIKYILKYLISIIEFFNELNDLTDDGFHNSSNIYKI